MIKIHKSLPFLFGLGIGTLATVLLFFLLRPARKAPQWEVAPIEEEGAETYEESFKEVILFFLHEERDMLFPERRKIYRTSTPASQAEQIIAALIEGSDRGLNPVLPPETRLRGLYISPSGTAYIDFSSDIRTSGRLGTSGELHAVYSVVNSLTFNIPEIQSVRFLVDGEEVKTLAGHISVEQPLREDFQIVQRDAPIR